MGGYTTKPTNEIIQIPVIKINCAYFDIKIDRCLIMHVFQLCISMKL